MNKKYINKREQLKLALEKEIENFLLNNASYLSSFTKVVVYYDNGQKVLTNIIDKLFSNFNHIKRKIEFNHTTKRLFQVADMMTVLDKLEYKRTKNIPFSNAELYFLELSDLKHIITLLKSKRL